MGRRNGTPLVLASVLTAVLLSACSGGGGGDEAQPEDEKTTDEAKGDGDGGEIDACKFVTQQDAEDLFGVPVEQSEDESPVADPNRIGVCIWEANPGPTSFVLLQFQVYDGEQYYGGDLFKDEPTFTELEGIGDKAFATGPNEAGGSAVQFVVDGKTVLLDASATRVEEAGVSLDPQEAHDKLVELAKKVAQQLG